MEGVGWSAVANRTANAKGRPPGFGIQDSLCSAVVLTLSFAVS